ncbi:hypothetical protein OQX61_15180 [Pedobacter sp. PLR]|uniref:hypothetical protein n=1 Tax=Pedobacter sp. PLR TaxID=2994465 RepID=UPI002247EC86|nr:hypothetical protein [Pedobacter sp. PLR]MCX2452619.1 hypothetical protein [Pedobacter sp. PLR]
MKYIYYSLICCFFALTARAQDAVVFPYQVIANKMVIQIKLNGKLVPMIFDTGGRNSISTALKTEFNASVVGTMGILDANSNRKQIEVVELEAVGFPIGEDIVNAVKSEVNTIKAEPNAGKAGLENGVIVFKNPRFLVLDSEIFPCIGVQGYIGSDLLQDCTVDIDDQKKEIRITKGGRSSLMSDRQVLPFVDDAKGIPIVTLNVGKYDEIRVMFDTGSDAFLSLKNDAYEKLKTAELVQVIREGEGGGSIGVNGRGGAGKQTMVQVPELLIGAFMFTNARAKLGNPPETLLGYQSLKYGKVTIDYVNKLFLFSPFSSDKVDLTNAKHNWNLEIYVHDGQYLVATVWGKLIGQVAVGDVLTHINGKVIKPIPFCESLTTGLPILKENTKLVFTLKTKSGVKNITVLKD